MRDPQERPTTETVLQLLSHPERRRTLHRVNDVHLPKLQMGKVVVDDSDQQTVRRDRHFEGAFGLLASIEEYRESTSTLTA